METFIADNLPSYLLLIEEVLPHMGLPEVYNLMRDHRLDRMITNNVRMALDMVRDFGFSCPDKPIRMKYTMSKFRTVRLLLTYFSFFNLDLNYYLKKTRRFIVTKFRLTF